jgi:hypothetical protein
VEGVLRIAYRQAEMVEIQAEPVVAHVTASTSITRPTLLRVTAPPSYSRRTAQACALRRA